MPLRTPHRSRRSRTRAAHLAQRKAERRTQQGPGAPPVLLVLVFCLSGAAGLVHEVIRARLLGHVSGASSLAISTVLAAFMGGLALGSWAVWSRPGYLTTASSADLTAV